MNSWSTLIPIPAPTPTWPPGTDGSFVVTWAARDMTSPTVNGLDIYARSYTGAGVGGAVMQINSYLYGDQYAPRISAAGTDYLIVWTSKRPQEGVYGQFVRGDGSFTGGQFSVNTTSPGQQTQSVVASDGVGRFLAVWTSFAGLADGLDLYAQRYLTGQQPLAPLPAPFVYAPFVLSNGVYQPQLVVSWPPVTGMSVSNYEVYVDGATSPMALTRSNVWTMTAANGLVATNAHSFILEYLTTDARLSPPSPSASGTTWSGINWGGIPTSG